MSETASPTPSHRRPPAEGGLSRRWFVFGGAGVIAAGGGGIALGLLRPRRHGAEVAPTVPPALLAAVATEQKLLASIDAAVAAKSASAAILRRIRTDHAAHLDALQAAVHVITGPPTPTSASTSPPTAPAATLAQLREAEQHAASSAAAAALALTGSDATLLASISACEACHVELLT